MHTVSTTTYRWSIQSNILLASQRSFGGDAYSQHHHIQMIHTKQYSAGITAQFWGWCIQSAPPHTDDPYKAIFCWHHSAVLGGDAYSQHHHIQMIHTKQYSAGITAQFWGVMHTVSTTTYRWSIQSNILLASQRSFGGWCIPYVLAHPLS